MTGRDRELVGHLGLVRYLRTKQIEELVFRGRAQSVVSARLGELAERHGSTRALIKKLWFVSGEGKRVLVWALTPSGYTLAEEVLGRRLKVPRHDVAAQFLEHATGVNDIYVALAKRPDAPQPALRGKPAADFARVPTIFRWVPSEELELPFEEYVRDEGRKRDRRLQPDALLEDLARRRRYLIEYETGSATVRNTQHKSATLTKLTRYANFFHDYSDVLCKTTYYRKHFADDYAPVLLFVTRTAARRDTIATAVTEWSRSETMRFSVPALTLEQASTEFRALLLGERPRVPAAVAPHEAFLSWRELHVLRSFQEEALQTIQRVRHMVRAGQPVASEPRYPAETLAAERLLQRLFESKPVKPQ